MDEQRFKIAAQLAQNLNQHNTDPNEVAKSLTYLVARQEGERGGQEFFDFLRTVVNSGDAVVRSGRTLDHYRQILQVCERHLKGYQDEPQRMAQILGWAVRLMPYYKIVPHLPKPETQPEDRKPGDKPPKLAPEERPQMIADLEPGMQLSGAVTRIAKFGAFVDIGVGGDGLVHISELREGYVQSVEDVVSSGDAVTVWVKDVDTRRKRIGLTMIPPKQVKRKLSELKVGEVVEGVVRNILNFGAFVDIGAEKDGLVHVSEMAEERIEHPSEVVSRGEMVRVRVIEVDTQRGRMGLSMKDVPR
jgi:predicted RNA-binding protein with RPS1 domain